MPPASGAAQGRRLLFIAEAVTLAHVARASVVAKAAVARGHEVVFCVDPRFNHLFGDEARTWKEVHTIPLDRFARAIDRGTPIYDERTLSSYAEEDRRLITTYAPDAVVGDFRLSLSVSARVSGVPYVSISNAYWSPYAAIRYPIPDIPLASWLGVGLAQRVFDMVRPVAFALHAVALNRLRKRSGLSALKYDLRYAYTDADLTLYADLEEVVPVENLPDRHRFVGPLLWAPDVPLPDWWDRVPVDRPIVYVNLGSSGRSQLLPVIVEAAGTLPVTALVATAGLPPPVTVPSNVRLAAYLPGDLTAERCHLVINNGGSPGCYQALAAGRPVLGVPHNLDQFLNMSLLERCGTGVLLRPERVSVSSLAGAVAKSLASESIKAAALPLRERIHAAAGPGTAVSEIEKLWS